MVAEVTAPREAAGVATAPPVVEATARREVVAGATALLEAEGATARLAAAEATARREHPTWAASLR